MKTIESFEPTKRFSDRVTDYVKYRPSYPMKIIEALIDYFHISPTSIVADIGSGTGIFTELLLSNGLNVIGVEPNDEMRKYAEENLGDYSNFTSIDGSAENTTLDSKSIDIVTVAQAFHWFNIDNSIREFYRILKTDGAIVLLWNVRKCSNSSFQAEYEELINTHCPDYKSVDHKKRTLYKIHDFFNKSSIDEFHFDNEQIFNFDSLIGRLRSSSYSPTESDKKYSGTIL